nr:MAG TPA: hypothetical protein [Caudoviricetes sp.]
MTTAEIVQWIRDINAAATEDKERAERERQQRG